MCATSFWTVFVWEPDFSQDASRDLHGSINGKHIGSGSGGEEDGEEEREKQPYVRPQTTTKLEVPEDGELLKDGTVRINVWASPRSLSTVLMYSFAQVRAVVDRLHC